MSKEWVKPARRYELPDGRKLTAAQIAAETGLEQNTVNQRINNGWTWEEILTIPTGGVRTTDQDARDAVCRGCRHWRYSSGMMMCHYFIDTGEIRTAYRRIKVERCERKRAAMAAGKG